MSRYVIRKTKGPTAKCVVCNFRYALRLDGLIRMHPASVQTIPNQDRTCPGSRVKPVQGSIEAP
jgi:hypothetical protein